MFESVAVYRTLKKDLDAVESHLEQVLLDQSSKASEQVIRYILNSKGKLIRPILVFLSAYAVKEELSEQEYTQLLDIATAIEVVHTASLLHDDVIDEAETRRGRESVNKLFGEKVAVTMGVYFYSISLQLIAQTGLLSVLTELSVAVKQMCEGELLQDGIRNQQHVTESEYFSVITSKTAALFTAACQSSALVVKASEQEQALLKNYATQLGLSFQLTDDYLDCFGKGVALNKTVGQDYLQGQLTLPLIYALEGLNAEDKALFQEKFETRDIAGLDLLKKSIEEHAVKERVLNVIKACTQKGKESLSGLESNEYGKSLAFLLDYVQARIEE